jgi:hypothetical protein
MLPRPVSLAQACVGYNWGMFAVRQFSLNTAIATAATVGARAIIIKTTTTKG